jgi:AP2 domain/HNH endonuclease
MSYVTVKDSAAILVVESETHGVFNVSIDVEDADRVAMHNWRVNKDKRRIYFLTHIKKPNGMRTALKLHRFIMNAPDGVLVDHKDPHNMLDNKRSNLRLATNQENSMNTRSHAGSSSQYKGVSWFKKTGKWMATCNRKYLGLFDSELDAARAYDATARELFGEFVYLNFPDAIAA